MQSISEIEEAIAGLERDWEAKRATFLVRGRDGELRTPTGAHLIPRVLIIVGSVVVMASLSATSLPPVFVYAMLIPFAIATFQLIAGGGKSDAFDRAQSEYEGQRSALIRKLEQAKP